MRRAVGKSTAVGRCAGRSEKARRSGDAPDGQKRRGGRAMRREIVYNHHDDLPSHGRLFTAGMYTVWKRCGIGHSGCFRTKIRVSRVRKLNFDLINLFPPTSMVRYHRNWYFRTLATGILRQKSHTPFMSYPNIRPTIYRSTRTHFYFSDHRKIKRRTSYKTDGMSIITPVSKLLLSRAECEISVFPVSAPLRIVSPGISGRTPLQRVR